MKRREFVIKSAAMGMMAPFAAQVKVFGSPAVFVPQTENIICTFSKTFQWLGYDDLAGFLADAGYEGIDLPIRPGGHVLPDNVDHDFPAAVKAARKHGLSIPMIVTAITDVTEPFTERILKTAADQGVKYYRLGYYRYDSKLTTQQNLDKVRSQLEALCKLNAKYGLQGGYQNHVGANVGSPVWDLWYLIKDLDPRYIGCQYDVRHAAAEGINSWPLGFDAIASHVKHECIKDYVYTQDHKGKWTVKSVPLGTGAVDFKKYFTMRKKYGINGPLSIHYEFDLGDDESLPAKERMKRIMPVVRKEVETLRTLMKESS
ncbi:MAG: sugar phosphate isomerase/epimerase [Bacteroidales bacterium]|jgi:sugar phosphate isomerase/epimerase|nr:sugar phosphate isomerase/epimerase [Bacteroidales bacterium]